MSLIITDAGIAAAIRAGDLGIEYKITHISIGSEGYVPDPAQTELVNEIQKKAITRGALVAPGQLHFETVWDGVEEFEGKELGYWLEDGTLFAVDSRNGDIITYKRNNTVVTEACELNLSASTISNITVELLGSPYATETVAGIAKVATSEQVTAGTDDRTILTPKKLKEALSDEQFAKYDPDRTYYCGDTCYTRVGNRTYQWEAYSLEPFSGKDPSDPLNRRAGWTDVTKPFYWKPYTPKVPGETMAWDNDAIPENMVLGIGQQLPVAVYHSLAAAKPEWIDETDNTLVNIPDRQGRFVRAADGTTWLAGERHEDGIRNITGSITNLASWDAASTDGVFGNDIFANRASNTAGTNSARVFDFDASRVVPTTDENQPKAFIEWVGYAL